MQQLRLRKFDISSIADDKVVVLIGKRDTGKSYLVRDLLFHHRDMPIGTCISPTESANRFFSEIIPPLFIHEEYTKSSIANVVRRQKMVLDYSDRQKKVYGQSDIDPRAFLLLDDCMYDDSWTKDKNIRLLFMNGRHYKIMFIITMQYPLGIPPNLRTNIDYVFVLRENITKNRQRIYENYAGMFPTFEIFNQVMDQCTENYECLVIHNNAKSNKLEDQVFWYKANNHGPFQVGGKEFWSLSKELGADRADDDDEEGAGGMDNFDPASARNKRGPIVAVKKSMY